MRNSRPLRFAKGGTSRPSPYASRRSVHLLSQRQEVQDLSPPSQSEGGEFSPKNSMHWIFRRQEWILAKGFGCSPRPPPGGGGTWCPRPRARAPGNSAATINWIFMRQDLILMRQGASSRLKIQWIEFLGDKSHPPSLREGWTRRSNHLSHKN